MQSLNDSTLLFPVIILGTLLLVGLFIFSRRSLVEPDTKDCPHCKKSVDASATECSFCLRKVVYV